MPLTLGTGAGWLKCPACGKKLLYFNEDTVVRNLPVYCKKCKRELLVSCGRVSDMALKEMMDIIAQTDSDCPEEAWPDVAPLRSKCAGSLS